MPLTDSCQESQLASASRVRAHKYVSCTLPTQIRVQSHHRPDETTQFQVNHETKFDCQGYQDAQLVLRTDKRLNTECDDFRMD